MLRVKGLKTKLLITAAVLLFAVILYISPFSCAFLEILGIPCPGCGMTRALIAAVSLNLNRAFSYHFMFWSVPILYICFLLDGRLFKDKRLNSLFYIFIGIGFAVNWIYKIFVEM